MTRALLWPTFAMVALTIAVWFLLLIARMRHVRHKPPDLQTFATAESSRRYFQPVEPPAQNLSNLFETPVLFFAIVPLLIIAHAASGAQVVLAWLFVVFRAVHSFVHIFVGNVRLRAPAYWAACGLVFAMWIGFFVDVLMKA